MYVSVSQESPNFLIDLLPIDKLGGDSTFPLSRHIDLNISYRILPYGVLNFCQGSWCHHRNQIISSANNANHRYTVKLGNKELFGHPKIVP